MRLLANTMTKRAMISAPRNTWEATGKVIFGCGGYLRWRIGLGAWQYGVDRPGAHGVNSLSGLRGYGGRIPASREAIITDQ